ncbi:MAG: DNA repair protein, partial [Actinotalea sp.]|nr:DNA repair protein [Actinotalea sp.]
MTDAPALELLTFGHGTADATLMTSLLQDAGVEALV